MGMTRFLLALYPREWRESFGDEFAALLEDTHLDLATTTDVMVQAAKLHVHARRHLLSVFAATVWSAGLEVFSLRAGLTANIMWAPTNVERALALAATVGPWVALAGTELVRRHGRRPAPPRSRTR
jgi:hypothetical protein